jgi:hypothetical protein
VPVEAPFDPLTGALLDPLGESERETALPGCSHERLSEAVRGQLVDRRREPQDLL